MIYPIEIFNGHIIIRTQNDIILVDTGASNTIHAMGEFDFAGQLHACRTNLGGITIERISQLLGLPITTLLGMDIMKSYRLRFDYAGLEVEFEPLQINDMNVHGEAFPLHVAHGIPVLQVMVENVNRRFLLDTGAQYSYLSDQLITVFPPAGEVADFHPALGPYRTICHEVPLTLLGQTFNIRCATPPAQIQQILSATGCSGILGFDLFSRFKIIIDPGQGLIYCSAN